MKALLHFVAGVKWNANYENPERFVAAHFLAVHSFNSCLHLPGLIFSFAPSAILYNPEEIIQKAMTSQYGEPHIGLFRPPHNRQKQALEKIYE
jgi:hypothetical protein